jgi:hypothetical protein
VLQNVLRIAREARAALAGFWQEEPNEWRIVTSQYSPQGRSLPL